MDELSQIRAIVDRLAGRPGVQLPMPAEMDEPWRTIYLRVHKAGDFTGAEQQIYTATQDLPDGISLAREVVSLIPSGDIFAAYPSLLDMDVRFPPVSWLWPSWVPRRMLTILGAAPGAGKSLLALDLARRVIEGLPLPDGAPPARRGRVLVIDAEGAPLLLQERARAWAFDRHRLFLMLPQGPDEPVDLSSPACQDSVRERCYNIQPELLVVDSLAAATSRGETSLEGARTVLTFLSALADQFEMALLVIHHLRRRSPSGRTTASQPGPEDLRGSSHLSAAARSVLTLSLSPGPFGEPDLNSPRRLEVVKTNLCPYPRPLRLTLEGGPASVPTLRYDPYVDTAPPPHARLCADWLVSYLAAAGVPVRPCDVVEAARQAGFSRLTLYRARRACGARIADIGTTLRDPHKRWALTIPGG